MLLDLTAAFALGKRYRLRAHATETDVQSRPSHREEKQERDLTGGYRAARLCGPLSLNDDADGNMQVPYVSMEQTPQTRCIYLSQRSVTYSTVLFLSQR